MEIHKLYHQQCIVFYPSTWSSEMQCTQPEHNGNLLNVQCTQPAQNKLQSCIGIYLMCNAHNMHKINNSCFCLFFFSVGQRCYSNAWLPMATYCSRIHLSTLHSLIQLYCALKAGNRFSKTCKFHTEVVSRELFNVAGIVGSCATPPIFYQTWQNKIA